MFRMLRRIAVILVLGALVLLVSEAVGLSVLRLQLSDHQAYWKGRANQPGEFVYVALGDSAAQGTGASRPENSYVGLLAKQIASESGRQVRVVNLSVSGATVGDALRSQIPQLENLAPDLVTAEIGANDMRHYDTKRFAADYEQFLQALPPGRSIVSDMPYFANWPAQEHNVPDANRTIARLTGKYHIPLARLHDRTLASQRRPDRRLTTFAADFFHPNDRGYNLWQQAFAPAVGQILADETPRTQAPSGY